MRARWRTVLRLALVAFVVSGCIDHGNDIGEENAVPDSGWQISEDPILVLGGSGSPPGQYFERVAGATLGRDSTLFLADEGRGEVLQFAPTGELLNVFGRTGDGPGEFRRIGSLYLDNDSGRLSVFDPGLQRVTGFYLSHDSVEVQQLQSLRPISALGPLGIRWRFGRTGNRIVPSPLDGMARDTVLIYSIPDTGNTAITIGEIPGSWSNHTMVRGVSLSRHALFSAFPSVAAVGSCLLFTPGDESPLLLANRFGQTVKEIRLPIINRPVTEGDRERWIASVLGQAKSPEERQMLQESESRRKLAPTFPSVSSMAVDDLGFIWLQRPDSLGRPSRHVLLVDAGSSVVKRIKLPVDGTILTVSLDLLVLSHREETGSPVVSVYSLSRGGMSTTRASIPPDCQEGAEP